MIGKTLSHYKILSKLGQGGQGEVYLAEDSRLDRKVALKILPEHLSERADLRERFEREARAVSSLNHPHICTLHDIGEQDGIHYLVMEHLEGESLADRLEKGALSLEQTLEYAIQIADALDKAHRQGVVHRDLKPGNIMLVKSGAKLLDFGLAKLKATEATEENLSELPTEQASLTAEGTILGTLQYMAPEQLEAKDTDSRTDIFAFGAAVYEMATGKKAFEGSSQASLIAAIMEKEPRPMAELQPMTPSAIDRVVKKCLAKEPDSRWQTASDLQDEMKWITEGGSQAVPAPLTAHSKIRDRLGWVAAALLFVITVVALAVPYLRRPATAARPVRFAIFPSAKGVLSWHPSVEISPDGTQVAFIATVDGKQFLWVRPLDSLQARPLPGTEGASFPFWSPDGQNLAFVSGTKLYKIAISGGSPQDLCDVLGTYRSGGTWSRDGIIVFGVLTGPLYQVAAVGGEATPVTVLNQSKQEWGHVHPDFLPDGRHFLYLARSSVPENNAVYLRSLDSEETRRLLPGNSIAKYGAPGYLFFGNQSVLMAQPFDSARLELSGEPFPVVDTVYYDGEEGDMDFSVSTNGVLVYRRGSQNTRLVWVDRTGKEIRAVGPAGEYRNPAVSPDETRIAITRNDPQTGNRDLWLYDLARDTPSRFTFHSANESDPVWPPDGQYVVFSSNRENTYGLYQKLASGVGQEEALVKSDVVRFPRDWSVDGHFIVYETEDAKTEVDLWALPLLGDQEPFPFLQTEFPEREGSLSPNGSWMVYDSTESGRREVYVQSFPTPGSKWQVSTQGGSTPKWRKDGRELFYLANDNRLMAVPRLGR